MLLFSIIFLKLFFQKHWPQVYIYVFVILFFYYIIYLAAFNNRIRPYNEFS